MNSSRTTSVLVAVALSGVLPLAAATAASAKPMPFGGEGERSAPQSSAPVDTGKTARYQQMLQAQSYIEHMQKAADDQAAAAARSRDLTAQAQQRNQQDYLVRLQHAAVDGRTPTNTHPITVTHDSPISGDNTDLSLLTLTALAGLVLGAGATVISTRVLGSHGPRVAV